MVLTVLESFIGDRVLHVLGQQSVHEIADFFVGLISNIDYIEIFYLVVPFQIVIEQ